MGRKSGVSEKTFKRIVLDSGVIFLNWPVSPPGGWTSAAQLSAALSAAKADAQNPLKMLGACRGGSTYTIETEWRDMPVDGIGGIVRGARRPLSVAVTLTANLLEINGELLTLAIPGAEATEFQDGAVNLTNDGTASIIADETMVSVSRIMEAAIPDFNYYNVAIVGKYSGTTSPIILVVENAMSNANLEISLTDEDESVLALNFAGTFDPLDIDREPWQIIVPEAD